MSESDNNCKKVLIIAYGFPPIAYAGTHRTLRFCKYLPDNGWIPTVITIKEDNELHNDYNLLKRLPKKIKIHRTNNIDVWRSVRKRYISVPENKTRNRLQALIGKSVKRIQSLILNLFSIPDHMLFWVPFAVIKGIILIKNEDYDVIYTTSPPHSEHLVGFILSKICRKTWVVDFRDPIVDNFCSQDLTPVARIINGTLERIIVHNADKIILVSDYHLERMRERYPLMSDKFTVIKNGFDPELYNKLEPCMFNKFTIIYTGSFYGSITPDFFIRGLKQWVDSKDSSVGKDIQVLFYGFGNMRVEALAKELGLENVISVNGFIPQDEILKKQKGAHLLLLIISSDEKSRGIISSKIYEYMAAGCPILAIIPEGEALKVLSTYPKYYHVSENDYNSLIVSLDAAYTYYQSKKHGLMEKDNHSYLDESAFNAKVQVRDLVSIFNKMVELN